MVCRSDLQMLDPCSWCVWFGLRGLYGFLSILGTWLEKAIFFANSCARLGGM